MEAWEELPDDLKLIVEKMVWESAMREYGREEWLNREAQQVMLDSGCTIEPIPADIDEALVATAQDFYARKASEDSFYAEVYSSILATKEYLDSIGIR